MTIKAEFLPGTEIEAAFAEASRVAGILGVQIEFPFNDVTCFARPGGDAKRGAEHYRREFNSDSKYKTAFN